jgi:hypothetical protein
VPTYPVAGIVLGGDMPPHYEPHPQEWDYTGYPSVVIIDKENPEHWQRFVWQFVANSNDLRQSVENAEIDWQQFGYNIGYYPLDIEDWEMVPDGPYCAACVRLDAEQMQPGDEPIAYTSELQDQPDEDSDGKYDRCSAGCGEVLYAVSDDD